jgi:long-subunit fatty acid transport protein
MKPSTSLVALAVSIGGCVLPAAAQTNDHIYRSWDWSEEPMTPRAAGMGGGTAGLPDDASLVNPAALATLSKTEVLGGIAWRGRGTSRSKDVFAGDTGLGQLTAAGRVGSRWSLGAAVSEPYAVRITLDPTLMPDRRIDVGQVEATVLDLTFAAAWRATPKMQLGGRLSASRLELNGTYERQQQDPRLPANLHVDTSASDTRPSGSLGFLYSLGSRLWFGGVATAGTTWEGDRTAKSAIFGVVLDPGSRYHVRRPSVLTGGISFQPSLKLLVTAQVDRVSYSEIRSEMVIAQGAAARTDYVLADGWEPRVGAELSLPFRNASVQLRAGVHIQAPGALLYTGNDVVESAAFQGARRATVASAGGSFVSSRWLRLDVAARWGGDRPGVLVGTAVRF